MRYVVFSTQRYEAQPAYFGSLVCSIPHLEGFKSSSGSQILGCIKNHLEGLLKPRFLSPIPRDSDSVGLGWAQEIAFPISSQVMLLFWSPPSNSLYPGGGNRHLSCYHGRSKAASAKMQICGRTRRRK